MKRIKRTATIFAFLIASVTALSACTSNETVTEFVTELSYYDGTYREELDDLDKPQYNRELWRRAELTIDGADPMILDDTANSGYYYAYSTGLNYYFSENLEDWYYGGSFVSLPSLLNGADSLWAPEVIYDEDEERYFAFFTLNPPPDTAYEMTSAPVYLPMAAVSETPVGPFEIVDFYDKKSSGENVRQPSEDYPQFYARYSFFDNLAYQEAFEREGLEVDKSKPIYAVDGGGVDEGWVRAIDFHPYVDPQTGDKYLYWSQAPGAIAGVKMFNWLSPDWSTFKTLTACLYYTIEDYIKACNGESVEKVFYEEAASYCNEGPFMYYHNGKYYLTFSIGSYDQSSYGVMQAVGDSPLGPFRKLTDSENGMMLNNDIGNNEAIAGPGHHSFIDLRVGGEEKLIIAYHAHNDPNVYTGRHVQFDEVKWVTVKDINGQDLDVMHVNGPTVTVQPTFGIGKDYGDISSSISEVELIRGELAEGSSTKSMSDGLISFFTRVSKEFNDTYVQETTVTTTSTFELVLESAREVRGIMFYNSKNPESAFNKIKDIAFICEENGAEKIYYIEELNVDRDATWLYDEMEDTWTPIFGGGCYAEFAGINVKSIRFTVEVPEGQEKAAVSEIALVGAFGSEA